MSLHKYIAQFLIATPIAFFGMTTTATSAEKAPAKHEVLAILVDLSGSMDDPTADGSTRIEIAIEAATNRLSAYRSNRHVAIFAFENTNGFREIKGFPDVTLSPEDLMAHSDDAADILADMVNSSVQGRTNFAGAFCDVVDRLVSRRLEVEAQEWRIDNNPIPPLEWVDLNLFVVTDGEENATSVTSECYGPDGKETDPEAPWNVQYSWQWKVKNKLFTNDPNSPVDPDYADLDDSIVAVEVTELFGTFVNGNTSAYTHFTTSNISSDQASTITYQNLAASSGGKFISVNSTTDLVIPGDVNHDSCVDLVDYYILENEFGRRTGETDIPGDFNYDRRIDTQDILTWNAHWGEGPCLTELDTARSSPNFILEGHSVLGRSNANIESVAYAKQYAKPYGGYYYFEVHSSGIDDVLTLIGLVGSNVSETESIFTSIANTVSISLPMPSWGNYFGASTDKHVWSTQTGYASLTKDLDARVGVLVKYDGGLRPSVRFVTKLGDKDAQINPDPGLLPMITREDSDIGQNWSPALSMGWQSSTGEYPSYPIKFVFDPDDWHFEPLVVFGPNGSGDLAESDHLSYFMR